MTGRSPKAEDVKTPEPPATTTLDEDTSKPSTTAPGDGPADTTDPTEQASSSPVQPGALAHATGTVNAVVPVEGTKADDPAKDRDGDEFEEYYVTNPDNKTLSHVKRNLRSGRSEVLDRDAKLPTTDGANSV